ncbi:hypothetical protein ADL25_33600 [Streptomyces sp. NRRL F-5122]|nr:hypothetical protein ADL25_33600 [Streptomyces sp. NRRL F-5122]
MGLVRQVGGLFTDLRHAPEGRSRESYGCRILRPRRSSGVSVLVDDCAEMVVSAYAEVVDSFGFERLGQGAEGYCGVPRSVSAALVVVPFVGAQRLA